MLQQVTTMLCCSNLCHFRSPAEISIENLERLYAVRRALQDDLEVPRKRNHGLGAHSWNH